MREIEKLMSDTYVIKGYITLCGVIRVLEQSVPMPDSKYLAFTGLECWSQGLIKYGKGDFSARINERKVEIVNQNSRVVDKIPFNKFMAVESHGCIVLDNGYLHDEIIMDVAPLYKKALDQADRGEMPDILDNSRFVRVSTKLKGKKLIALERSESGQKTKAVFMPDGTPVDFKESTPLSYKRWCKIFVTEEDLCELYCFEE